MKKQLLIVTCLFAGISCPDSFAMNNKKRKRNETDTVWVEDIETANETREILYQKWVNASDRKDYYLGLKFDEKIWLAEGIKDEEGCISDIFFKLIKDDISLRKEMTPEDNTFLRNLLSSDQKREFGTVSQMGIRGYKHHSNTQSKPMNKKAKKQVALPVKNDNHLLPAQQEKNYQLEENEGAKNVPVNLSLDAQIVYHLPLSSELLENFISFGGLEEEIRETDSASHNVTQPSVVKHVEAEVTTESETVEQISRNNAIEVYDKFITTSSTENKIKMLKELSANKNELKDFCFKFSKEFYAFWANLNKDQRVYLQAIISLADGQAWQQLRTAMNSDLFAKFNLAKEAYSLQKKNNGLTDVQKQAIEHLKTMNAEDKGMLKESILRGDTNKKLLEEILLLQ